jgi:hypothetical protein
VSGTCAYAWAGALTKGGIMTYGPTFFEMGAADTAPLLRRPVPLAHVVYLDGTNVEAVDHAVPSGQG